MSITTEAVVLRSPAECIANIPALLGFTPNESVVAVWIKNETVLVTQRADIEGVLDNPDQFVAPLRQHDPDEVVLVFWTEARENDRVTSLIARAIDVAESVAYVRDAMWVTDGRWGSLICSDSECCPPGGREIDPCLKAQELPDPIGSRDELLAECKPVGNTLMKPLDPHGIDGWRDKQIDRILSAYFDGGFDSIKHVGRAGRALHDIRVRDVILWKACELTADECRDGYDLASAVARSMHPDNAAPACTVAAVLAWLMGDGARANVAVDHALASDPSYSLALLVQASLGNGLPPQAWREAMSTLDYETVRNGSK